MATNSNVSRVRLLYKAILRLHRGLPLEMKALGDQYVKDEFRRHKNVNPSEAQVFMDEWTKYYLTLGKQLSRRVKDPVVGSNLSEQHVDNFSDEQAGQLLELYKETQKPKSDSNDEQSEGHKS